MLKSLEKDVEEERRLGGRGAREKSARWRVWRLKGFGGGSTMEGETVERESIARVLTRDGNDGREEGGSWWRRARKSRRRRKLKKKFVQ